MPHTNCSQKLWEVWKSAFCDQDYIDFSGKYYFTLWITPKVAICCVFSSRELCYFIFPAHLHSGVQSFQLPKPEQGGKEWKYSCTTNLFQAFQCQMSLSVSDKPLTLCCIQLRGMAHGMDGNEPVLSVWASWETEVYWKGCAMGAVEKDKEYGYF